MSEGLATESFHPGPQTMGDFSDETLEELTTIFPELDPETGRGYGPSVRRSLKTYEAKALIRSVDAKGKAA